MATLLPNAVQQFCDQNGTPLASGSVNFYVPNTLTRKDTWSDSGATILNTNPIILNASGENPAGGIYGSGQYRQVVYDSAGNLIWDQLTADTSVGGNSWGGTSTGSANAQAIAEATGFSQQDGQQVSFLAGYSNSGALTLSIAGGSPIPILRDGPAGPTACTGGEVVAQNEVTLVYDLARGAFHLVNPATGTMAWQNANAVAITGGTLTGVTVNGAPITSLMPIGAVLPYGGSTAPTSWLLCYGQAISRTTYAALFAVFSTTYGSGDGTTTFNVPDLRGRVPAGKDNMGGSAANRLTGTPTGGVNGNTLGNSGGDQGHTLTIAQMPSHDHDSGPATNNQTTGGAFTTGTASAQTHATTATTGGGGAHNNVQPTFILNYIVFAGV